MGHGGGGKDGIAVLGRSAGMAQADSQVFHQLRDMSSSLLAAEPKAVQTSTLFRPLQPACDDTRNAPPQYCAYSLFVHEQNLMCHLCHTTPPLSTNCFTLVRRLLSMLLNCEHAL